MIQTSHLALYEEYLNDYPFLSSSDDTSEASGCNSPDDGLDSSKSSTNPASGNNSFSAVFGSTPGLVAVSGSPFNDSSSPSASCSPTSSSPTSSFSSGSSSPYLSSDEIDLREIFNRLQVANGLPPLDTVFPDPFAVHKDSNREFVDLLTTWEVPLPVPVEAIEAPLRSARSGPARSEKESKRPRPYRRRSPKALPFKGDDDNRWTCPANNCGKKLSLDHGDQTVIRHLNTHGSDSMKWACPHCKKVVSRPDALIRHLRSPDHVACYKLVCQYGPKVFGKGPHTMAEVVQKIYEERGETHWSALVFED